MRSLRTWVAMSMMLGGTDICVAQVPQWAPQPAFESACAFELQKDQAAANMGMPDGGFRINGWRQSYVGWTRSDTGTLQRWAKQSIGHTGDAVQACGARFILAGRGATSSPQSSSAATPSAAVWPPKDPPAFYEERDAFIASKGWNFRDPKWSEAQQEQGGAALEADLLKWLETWKSRLDPWSYRTWRKQFENVARLHRQSCARLMGKPCPAGYPIAKRTAATSVSQSTTPAPSIPPPVKASPVTAVAPKTPAKVAPTPHLSDDQLVLNEMLRQQREKSDAIRKQRIDHINAEALRHDAITVTLKWVNKLPVFILRNNTDIILNYSLTWEMSTGGRMMLPESRPWMLSPFETEEFKPVLIYRDEVILIKDNEYRIKWSAHPWNFNHL